VHYSGVENSGIEGEVAYFSSELSLFSLSFDLFDMMEIELCHENVEADANNANECPGDGDYDFSVVYKLPDAGSETTSWLASGWEGSGKIQMYAEQNQGFLIGDCTMVLKTYVTQQSEEKNLVGTPSAAVAAGIAGGVAAMMGLVCLYCYCCRGKRGAKKNEKPATPDEVSTFFRKMEDEKTFWSGSRGSKSKKGNKGNQSVISDLA
jgi:hypothetical protein